MGSVYLLVLLAYAARGTSFGLDLRPVAAWGVVFGLPVAIALAIAGVVALRGRDRYPRAPVSQAARGRWETIWLFAGTGICLVQVLMAFTPLGGDVTQWSVD